MKRPLETSVKTVGKDSSYKNGGLYILSIDRKTMIYRLKAYEIEKTLTQLSVAMCSCVSLTCLWVQAYIMFIVAEPGFIIQYDTVQAPCNMWPSLAGKRLVWIKSLLTRIQYFQGSARFSHIISHISLPVTECFIHTWSFWLSAANCTHEKHQNLLKVFMMMMPL